ncbi:MAG: phosphoribosylglycinamide formyltransferase [Bacteriovoracaceae bacterium]
MTLENNNSIKTFAIMASGSGSNAENLIQTSRKLGANLACLICDQSSAKVLDRCKRLDVKAIIMEKTSSKERHEQEILAVLKEMEVNWLLLAGYMRLLSENFLSHFYDPAKDRNQVVNIHPSLLPEYPGLGGYQRAYEDQVERSGATVHFVDGGIDTGPIIEQGSFKREKNDDLASFTARGLALEHTLYARILEKIIKGQV